METSTRWHGACCDRLSRNDECLLRPKRAILHAVLLFLAGLLQGTSAFEAHDVEVAAQSRRAHAFFYLWYGTPEVDGQWQHWNHEVLPHWDAAARDQYPSDGLRYLPPGDVHSPFYPMRGCYSSRDAQVMREQLRELLAAGVGVVVLSWSGEAQTQCFTDTLVHSQVMVEGHTHAHMSLTQSVCTQADRTCLARTTHRVSAPIASSYR